MDEYTVKGLKSRLIAHLMGLDLKGMSLAELKIYAETVNQINDMEKIDALNTMINKMAEVKNPVGFGFTHPVTNTAAEGDTAKTYEPYPGFDKNPALCCCMKGIKEARVDG